ncbi:MAG: hypothetical protein OXB91_08630 [Bryobacterales bacterium]|nr:hypothetical protein [Bryobacterales bacterium]
MVEEKLDRILAQLGEMDKALGQMKRALDDFGVAQRSFALGLHEIREELKDSGVIFQEAGKP